MVFGYKGRRYPRHIRQSIIFGLSVIFALAGLYVALLIYDRFAITLAHKPGYLTANNTFMAVTPIRNYDFDEMATQWGQILTLNLTDRLSHHRAIRMIDRRSVKRLVDAGHDTQSMFHTLQLDYLLTGGIMRVDDQVVVTLHLIDKEGESLWAQSFAALWQDNAEFLVEMSERVYVQLDERIFPEVKRLVEEGIAKKYEPPKGQALKIFYEAQKLLARDTSNAAMMSSLLLRQALEIQPDLVIAHNLLAQIQYQQQTTRPSVTKVNWQEVNAELDDILERFGEQAIAYAIKADIAFRFRRNMPVAEIFYQQALRLRPSDADIRMNYAKFLVAIGRFYDAEQQVLAVKRLNPLAYPVLEAVWVFTMSGEFELAELELDKITPIKLATPDYYIVAQQLYQSRGDEGQAFGHYLNIFQHLGFAKGDIKESLDIYETDGLTGVNRWLALEKQLQLDIGQFLPPLSTAYYLATANEPELAMEYLQLAHQQQQLGLLWAKSDPRFAQLHDRPEFIALMKQVGFLYPEEI